MKSYESYDEEMKSYEDLVAELEDLPVTWYGALLRRLVLAAYKKNVFKPGGALVIVRQAESEIGKQAK